MLNCTLAGSTESAQKKKSTVGIAKAKLQWEQNALRAKRTHLQATERTTIDKAQQIQKQLEDTHREFFQPRPSVSGVACITVCQGLIIRIKKISSSSVRDAPDLSSFPRRALGERERGTMWVSDCSPVLLTSVRPATAPSIVVSGQ
jgi:hypothetical protein